MKLALLAGTHSGCGKTTIMLALLQYLQAEGLSPRAFKTGPDFLDPLWHAAVTGRESYNLDTEMVGIEQSRRVLARQMADGGLALIEGVMGLFDGRDGVGRSGSSVDLAKQLGAPVILVVDAHGMSGSIAPLVSGFQQFAEQRGASIAGIVANRVGSEHHAELLRDALAEYRLPPLLAWVGKQQDAVLKERHLGLKMPDARHSLPDFQAAMRVDRTALLAAFADIAGDAGQSAAAGLLSARTVAIARDSACCFIYPANVDWLIEQGADVVYFSPLAGDLVPDADALWLPGGYPELHAEQLSVSASLASIRDFIDSGRPVLAECGGAMLLGKALVDQSGQAWPMAGVLPFVSVMQAKLAALGYRRDASGMRGHEFHYSTRETQETFEPAFVCERGDNGIRYKNLRASYVHWYFSSAPNVAAQWLT